MRRDVDLLRYQIMLCCYDTMALKSLDIFSVHGFPAGLVQAESNLLGIHNGNSTNVGSGGWTNIIEKYTMNGGRSIERVSKLKRLGHSNGARRKAGLLKKARWPQVME
jgi:hypothetical protein